MFQQLQLGIYRKRMIGICRTRMRTRSLGILQWTALPWMQVDGCWTLRIWWQRDYVWWDLEDMAAAGSWSTCRFDDRMRDGVIKTLSAHGCIHESINAWLKQSIIWETDVLELKWLGVSLTPSHPATGITITAPVASVILVCQIVLSTWQEGWTWWWGLSTPLQSL